VLWTRRPPVRLARHLFPFSFLFYFLSSPLLFGRAFRAPSPYLQDTARPSKTNVDHRNLYDEVASCRPDPVFVRLVCSSVDQILGFQPMVRRSYRVRVDWGLPVTGGQSLGGSRVKSGCRSSKRIVIATVARRSGIVQLSKSFASLPKASRPSPFSCLLYARSWEEGFGETREAISSRYRIRPTGITSATTLAKPSASRSSLDCSRSA
jgi:hypothetical protein